MVMHTLAALMAVRRLAGVWVVISQGDVFFANQKSPAAEALHLATCGGATRAQSVANGLDALLQSGASIDDWVLVHDAARCLVTPEQIDRLIDACEGDAVGGLLALPLPDTLKHAAQGRVDGTLDRSDKWLAQTPQMFRIGALREALQRCGDAVTDESSAMESLGLQPLLVEGSAQNFKVTYPQDFALAQAVLQSRR
jgi:2-C-methyl-D-erythritol 4-phosphate cytidylyltransferase